MVLREALLDPRLLKISVTVSTLLGIPLQLYTFLRVDEMLPTTTVTAWLDRVLEQPFVFLPLVPVVGYSWVGMMYYWATTNRPFSRHLGWIVAIWMGPVGTVAYYYVAYRQDQEEDDGQMHITPDQNR